jgi:hypothetical protein
VPGVLFVARRAFRSCPGLALITVSGGLLALSWHHWATATGRDWEPAPAKVTDVRVFEGADGPRFEAWTTFEHEAEGKKLTGGSGVRTPTRAEAEASLPVKGQRITILRDPADPTRATAVPLPSPVPYLGLTAVAVFAAACGAMLLIGEARDERPPNSQPQDWARWGPT